MVIVLGDTIDTHSTEFVFLWRTYNMTFEQFVFDFLFWLVTVSLVSLIRYIWKE